MNVGSILNDDTRLDGRPTTLRKVPPRPPLRKDSDASTSSGIATLLNAARATSDDSSPGASPNIETPVSSSRHRQSLENILNDSKNTGLDPAADLLRLLEIKKSAKPRRYDSPPIWAQWYVSPRMRGPVKADSAVAAEPAASVFSNKRVFNRATTPSTDLECSISGIIPTPSIVKVVAEWIYANFRDIAESNRKHVELELKFGTIVDKVRGSRINLNVLTECIYSDQLLIHFDMLVAEKAWDEIHRLFAGLEGQYQDELKKAASRLGKPPRKFNTSDEEITDSFYLLGRPGEHPKSVRVSTDKTLNPPRYTAIEKQRLLDLYIHNPASMYDMRLSLSLEIPVAEATFMPLVNKSQPHLVREKKRNTFTHFPTISRFDLTRVLIPRQLKNKDGKLVVTHDKNYEIELEVNTIEMFNAVDKITLGTDLYRFEELVEIFINNGRVINNCVTKLAQT